MKSIKSLPVKSGAVESWTVEFANRTPNERLDPSEIRKIKSGKVGNLSLNHYFRPGFPAWPEIN
jgi:hypothetical protein